MSKKTSFEQIIKMLSGTKFYIDKEINKKANVSHGTHVSYSTTIPKANGSATVGSESGLSRGDHVHPLQTSVSGNAGTATKLATTRTIGLTGGIIGTATNFDGSSNINIPTTSIKEGYLSWGGKDFSGNYGCIDAAMVPALGANRLAFIPGEAVTIEYSRDSGATWVDYGASTSSKTALFSTTSNFVVGKADATNKPTKDYQLRITINTGAGKVYTALNKFCLYISSNGSDGCTCTIEKALESTPTSFTLEKANVPISGWSGYNIINTNPITTYGNTPTGQYGRLRFTFKITGHNSTYSGLSISRIYGYGGVGWTTPSTMAATGNLYSYNEFQEAVFPAKISAPSFSGSLVGNANTATKLATARTINGVAFDGTANITVSDSTKVAPTGTIVAGRIAVFNDTTGKIIKDSGFTIATSVPSGAKFTDTVYTHPANHAASIITQDANNRFVTDAEKNTWNGKASTTVVSTTANGLMSKEDKTKLDGVAANANNYSHPTTSGNKHVPSGGASGQFLSWTSDGTATWTNNPNTWRGIQDNLTSTATDQSLSANQGKVLKGLVDGKANTSHGTHVSYGGNGTAATVSRSDHTHTAPTTITGNAGSATKLQTARTINGTSFDGTTNITTANWGTTRSITIGDTVKSVNGASNVSWTLAEIGAAPISHMHTKEILGQKLKDYDIEKADVISQVESIASATELKSTTELTNLNSAKANYLSIYNSLVAEINKIIGGAI